MLREDARQQERLGEYLACGESYEELSQGAPAQDDELASDLYNAGVCFEDASAMGRALASFRRLTETYPRDLVSRKAIVRMASINESLARFGEAAHWYESYAKRYGGEKDAPIALSRAVLYRSALGETEAAVADTRLFTKNYKRRLKEESAALLFALPRLHERTGDVAAAGRAYRRYIVEVGKTGGLDRLLIAHARAGELAWNASCASPAADGSCLVVKRARLSGSRATGIQRCGPESTVDVEPRRRDAGRVAEARAFFASAVALGRGIDKIEDERKAAALYWLNASHFYLAELQFESFLGLQLPAGLDFSETNPKAREASSRRLATFIQDAESEMATMMRGYKELGQREGAGHWSVAAAARVAQVSQHFVDTLLTAHVPRSAQTGPLAAARVDAYCSTITSTADPIEELAVSAYGFCLHLAQKLDDFDSWSKLCESRLVLLRPEAFPRARELRDSAGQSGEVMDRVGLIAASASP